MAKFEAQDNTDLDVAGARVAIVAARFNREVVERLVEAALATLQKHGIADDDIELVRVPGAFEIPLAAQRIASHTDVDAIITLGAVVRGGTPHFEYVAGEVARGVAQVALDHGLPVIFGVLTTDDQAQALARAGGNEGNKGEEAAVAALDMVSLLRRLRD